MGRRAQRAASWLGLVRREGEPDPVFTRREQRLMLVVLVPVFALLVLGLVLRVTGRAELGLVATLLGLAVVIVMNVVLRRVRRARVNP